MTTQINSGGIGFVGLLTILFIGLKLTGITTWAWIWVLSPIWISIILYVALFMLAVIVAICIGILAVIFG